MTALLADWLASHGLDDAVDVLFVSAERFHCKPQTGVAARLRWVQLVDYLARPTIGDAKDLCGGFAFGSYVDNVRRQSALLSIDALVVDIDGNGDVDRVAGALERYRAIVLETFSSTEEKPRCRVVFKLATGVDVATYKAAHAVVRTHLRAALDVETDDGACDASRLSYAPVRRPGTRYAFAVTYGRALDAASIARLAVPPSRPASRPTLEPPQHGDRYIRAALHRAADALASARDGTRHETLNREAFTLARLGLSAMEISAALMPAWIAAAGQARAREGERTIRDAVDARKGAA